MAWEGPHWPGWLLEQHKPQPRDTLAVKDSHCCDSFVFLFVWFFVLKCRVLLVFNVFLKSLQRGCFQLMCFSKPSPPARKAGLRDLPRAVESDVPREPGTGFSGA